MSKKGVPVYYVPNIVDSGVYSEGRRIEFIDGNLYRGGESRVSSFYGSIGIRDEETGCYSVETAVVKSARGFGESVSDANYALEMWRKMGFKGSPASPASFTREMYKRAKGKEKIVSKCNASANNLIRDYFTGGWIECPETNRGNIDRRVYHYDINKAYLHAARSGLPSMLYPIMGGKLSSGAVGFVAVCRIKSGHDDLPNYLSRPDKDELVLVTSEEVGVMGLDIEIVRGVEYRDLDVDLSVVVEMLERSFLYKVCSRAEKMYKKCTQTFWGQFASFEGVTVEDYVSGNEYKLWNRYQNVCWAALIVRRVASMVYKSWMKYDGIMCYVDSIMTLSDMSELVGEEVGMWKEVGVYEKGVYLEAGGVWCELPFRGRAHFRNRKRWTKHSGY